MTIYTWNGSQDDQASNPLNWTPNGVPQAGDSIIATFGTIIVPTDPNSIDNSITVGGTAGVTVEFTGTDATTLSNPTLVGSTITNNFGSSQTSPLATVIDAFGNFILQDSTIIADGPVGSTMTIDVQASGSGPSVLPGFFINQGDIEADAGNTIDIAVGADSEVFNAGKIVANGGKVSITANADALVGGYAPMVGLVGLENGGTVVFDATPAYDPSTVINGTKPYFVFADNANDVLTIGTVADFTGFVEGFQAGDSIVLDGLTGLSIESYSSLGVLSLAGGGQTYDITIAGPFDFESFALGTVDGNTVITTAQTNDLWIANSGSNLWTDAANWGSNHTPGGLDIAQIGNGGTGTFTVSTGTGSVSAGGLLLEDPNATLEVAGKLQVFPGTYDSTVAQFTGTIVVDAAGDLFIDSLRQFTQGATLSLSPGATLEAEGKASLTLTSDGTITPQAGGDNFAMAIEGNVTVDGATINAGPGQPQAGSTGGSILIGQDGAGFPATVLVESSVADDVTTGASVTDTYATVYSSPTSYGELSITGQNTVWDDAGDPTDTQNTRGYIAVGAIAQESNSNPSTDQPLPPYAGAAQVVVSNGATLDEQTYANVGVTPGSEGVVTINNATWNVGNVGSNYNSSKPQTGFLEVGHYGTGSLTIEGGGTVAVGDGDSDFISDGNSQTIDSSVMIGNEASGFGTLSLESDSSLTTLNSVQVGNGGVGDLSVDASDVSIGAGNLDIGGGGSGPAAGAQGSVSVTDGGSIAIVAADVLAVWQGSSVSVDATSFITIDSTSTAGAISIANGAGLRGDGTVGSNVINDSNIHATNNGTYDLSTGGLLDITGNLSGSGTSSIARGATLEIGGSVAFTGGTGTSQKFDFLDQNGLPETLILGTPPASELQNAVSNLQDLDRIELAGLSITGATFSSGTVTVTTTGADYLLTDVGFAAGANHTFIIGTDPTTSDDYIQVTCFAAGTRIATEDGEIAVESLAVGERVITVPDRRARPIVWIGRRHIDCSRHPQPRLVWPVRVRAGAFGAGMPHRDLFLSPDHAVFIDGVLIPVRYLIDGRSVMQTPRRMVTYYHIELATHDVVLAEGLPTETYLDTGDRARFDNGKHGRRLSPDLVALAWEAKGCAPLVVTGPPLAAAAARLAGAAAHAQAVRPHAL